MNMTTIGVKPTLIQARFQMGSFFAFEGIAFLTAFLEVGSSVVPEDVEWLTLAGSGVGFSIPTVCT
jgi:hypothetical protein